VGVARAAGSYVRLRLEYASRRPWRQLGWRNVQPRTRFAFALDAPRASVIRRHRGLARKEPGEQARDAARRLRVDRLGERRKPLADGVGRRIVGTAVDDEGGPSMADTVRSVTYYYVTVPDAPGEVQRILSALQGDGVNLFAFLGFPVAGGRSQIDLVPEDPQALEEAAQRAGATLSEAKRAFLIQGDDRVGAVAEITGKLAAANVNVTAAAASAAGSGRYGMMLWVAPEDHERAATALGT
jgi:hypothetical protein